MRTALLAAASLASALLLGAAGGVELAELRSCAAIADEGDRLACYDALAARAAAEPESRAEPPEPRAEPPGGPWGLEKQTPEEPSQLSAAVVRAVENQYGKMIFTLDNGQVWEQSDYAPWVARKRQRPRVVIRKTFSGSYLLKLESGGRSIRVKRVR